MFPRNNTKGSPITSYICLYHSGTCLFHCFVSVMFDLQGVLSVTFVEVLWPGRDFCSCSCFSRIMAKVFNLLRKTDIEPTYNGRIINRTDCWFWTSLSHALLRLHHALTIPEPCIKRKIYKYKSLLKWWESYLQYVQNMKGFFPFFWRWIIVLHSDQNITEVIQMRKNRLLNSLEKKYASPLSFD